MLTIFFYKLKIYDNFAFISTIFLIVFAHVFVQICVMFWEFLQ